jgi:hypothetical protein
MTITTKPITRSLAPLMAKPVAKPRAYRHLVTTMNVHPERAKELLVPTLWVPRK